MTTRKLTTTERLISFGAGSELIGINTYVTQNEGIRHSISRTDSHLRSANHRFPNRNEIALCSRSDCFCSACDWGVTCDGNEVIYGGYYESFKLGAQLGKA